MRLRRMTKPQKWLAFLMTLVFLVLAVWLIPEIAGVLDPAAEDTYSEIIFDLPLGWVLLISLLHLVAGVVFVWSAGHFIEGYRRRKGTPIDDGK